MRSRLEPMKKVARMLHAHEELLLNWFRAKAEISSGAVEGLNKKIRVVTRRSYGFFGPMKRWKSPLITR
jgi:transposase